MSDYFGANSLALALTGPTKLRRAQLAAIWALGARVLGKNAVSQAILPTGVGKSAVIAALPFAVQSSRVLIVVPSKITRRQLAREFNTLAALKTLEVLPATVRPPRVKALEKGLRSTAQWDDLSGYDVVIATPNCVSSAYSNIAKVPSDLFDLLIIDEAHHAAATTWNRIIEDLTGVPAVLLTATPFRRDKRRIPGEIAYVYPLREAIADGVYSPIEFIAVERVDGEEKDLTLARATLNRLRLARHVALGSQAVVRTDLVDDAHRLRQVYLEVGLDFPVLTSELKVQEFDAIINDLNSGATNGVIVVGVLTEGFNLPKLKIAVYHKKHKSLAATLQFVGRLARTVDNLAMQAELLAMREDVSDETSILYQEDASWPELLPSIADAAVDEERVVREYLLNFSGKPEEFSLVAVEPRLRVQVFELGPAMPDFDLRFENIGYSPVIDSFVDEDRKLAAFVTREIVHPDWLRSTALDTVAYDLHIVCVDRNAQYIFIQSASGATTADIVGKYNLGSLSLVAPYKINSALHTFAITDYSMVGLRNKSPNAATGFSYKTVAGFSASRGVTHADQTTTSAGHLSARFMIGNASTTIGSSLDGGKFWQSTRSSLYDFREWCETLAQRLNSPARFNAPPSLNVSIREKLSAYPLERVLATVISHELLEGSIRIGVHLYSIADCRLVARSIGSAAIVGLTHGRSLLATAVIDVRGIATNGSRGGIVEFAGTEMTLADALNNFPSTLFFANGYSTCEGTIAAVPARLVTIDENSIEKWLWVDVDPRRESLGPRAGFQKNIQTHTIEAFESRSSDSMIIVDDGANEVADIIVLHRQSGHAVLVEFAHCKWSSEDLKGLRVKDLAEVLSQVCRSVRWMFPDVLSERLRARLLERPDRLKRGDMPAVIALLDQIASGSVRLSFAQYAIQPGIDIDRFLAWENGTSLATICANWCREFDTDFTLCGA